MKQKKTMHIILLIILYFALTIVLLFYINYKIRIYNYIDYYQSNSLIYAYGYQKFEFIINIAILFIVLTVLFARGLFNRISANSIWIFVTVITFMELGNYLSRLLRLYDSIVEYGGNIERFHQQYWLYISIFGLLSMVYFYIMLLNLNNIVKKGNLLLGAVSLMLVSTILLQSYYYLLLFNQYIFIIACMIHFIGTYFISILFMRKSKIIVKLPKWNNLKIIIISIVFIGIRLLILNVGL